MRREVIYLIEVAKPHRYPKPVRFFCPSEFISESSILKMFS
jgi:hypothetical protein